MYIGNSPASVGNYQVVDDISSTFNGVLTSFALTASSLAINPAKSGQLLVSINGVLQEPDDTGTSGFKVSGSNIVFSSPPATGSTFWAVWQGQAVDIGTPSDNTVGNAQVADDALSGNKIDGGTISNFTSTGIDDNATSEHLQVDDNGITVSGNATQNDNMRFSRRISSGLVDGGAGTPQYYTIGTVSMTGNYRSVFLDGYIAVGRSYTGATREYFELECKVPVLGVGAGTVSFLSKGRGSQVIKVVITQNDAVGFVVKLLIYNASYNSAFLSYDIKSTGYGQYFTPVVDGTGAASSTTLPAGTSVTPLEFVVNKNNGNVGIGTSAPTKQLDIFNPSQSWNQRASIGLATQSKGTYNAEMYYHRGTISEADRGLKFRVHDTLGMVIDSSGRVTMPYQPAFDAYHASGSYSSGTTATSLDLSSTRLNNGNHYNTSTDRFVAPVAGIYQFNYRVIVNGTVTSAHIRMQKNGSTMQGTDSHYSSGSGGWGQFQEQIVVSLSANDYVQVYHVANTAIYGNSYQSFNGHLIG